ncbi:MAG: efflux transporter outer membrane subunit [Phycisphaerales bacterium]|nr:efflux transporter outer membrane subunit [Phycisphaerales bacterium]
MNARPAASAAALALAVVAAGCRVGPAHATPPSPLPAAYAAAATDALAADEALLANWWTAFDDPALTRLVARALQDGCDVREAAARVAAARAGVGVAGAARWPTLGAGADATRLRLSGNALFAPPVVRTATQYEVGFDSSWELDLFGRVQHGVDAAAAELAVSEALAHDARVRLAAEVARTYLALRVAQARHAAAEQAHGLAIEQVALAQARAAAGVATAADVDAAVAAREAAAAVTPDFALAVAAATQQLAVLVAAPAAAIQDDLAAAAIPAGPAVVAAGLPADLLRRRPDVRAAERALAAQVARLGVATADLYPRLSLNGVFAFTSTSTDTLFDAGSRTFGFGPALQLPLFRGGALRAQLAAATAEADAANVRYERTVRAAGAEVETGLAALRLQTRRRDLAAAALAAEQQRASASRALHEQGLVDWSAVLAAEADAAARRGELAQAQGDSALARVTLFKALGGGWPAPATAPADAPAVGQ